MILRKSTPLLRRDVLLTLASSSLFAACKAPVARQEAHEPEALAGGIARLQQLESASGGRLGVAALATGNNLRLLHREHERFPFCSTFKVLLAAMMLKRSEDEPGLLRQQVRYTSQDLVPHAPVTERHLQEGMSLSELCAAALEYSDNTAGNLLIDRLGGTAGVTAFARSLGDEVFRLDRREVELNAATPGDPRDTTSPAAMMQLLQRLLLGDTLRPAGREQLLSWMLASTTGNSRIRAGVPAGWRVADKTGTGAYGVTNDIGLLLPPAGGAPVVLVLFYAQDSPKAAPNNDLLARTSRIAVESLVPA